jgi:rhodanese-related sulfurtransferase
MEELKALMDSGANIAILDVRPKVSYDMVHIEGAVSFPWKPQMTVGDLEMLPPGDPVITYCDCGPGEHDSASVAAQLLELGAEVEIKVLADPAIEGWVSAGYPTEPPAEAPAVEPAASVEYEDGMERISLEELKALMDSGARIAILDVRPKVSYDMVHIEGAVSFPWKPQMTVGDLEMLPPGDPVITYCDCGPGEHDSASVAAQLLELGAEVEIKVLADPSIEGWVAAGYPTEP